MEITGYENYLIYDDGRVFNKIKNNFVNLVNDKDGYLQITLYNNGKNKKTIKIHRLVALHYISNPNNLPQVDHINRIRTDNRIENLRWVSVSENNINKDVYKKNKLGLKNISKRTENCYRISFVRNSLKYVYHTKTKEEAIKQRDLMFSMF